MDVVLSLAAMPVALPVLAVCAIAIRLDSAGPSFFVQERLGQRGKPFRLIKLRTMVRDAEQLKAAVLDERTVHFKNLNDPRITRVGRFLRKMSLDELPQLFNVLRGEMSLIGPRPTSLDLVRYEPWHEARLELRPGITGLWQVRGRNAMSFDQRVQLDLEYIENLSFMTDLRLLLSTVAVVIRGTGA
ncbi:MAG: sugar transferase [Chloroflexi bacterium]|nr:sugar transferase [Actinomycetota bacterium]MBA3739623.1 sugar transferase [Chloroflexota bacterium]